VGLHQGVLAVQTARFEVPGAKVSLTASLTPWEKGLALVANVTSQRIAVYTLLSGAGLETPRSGLVRDVGLELRGRGHNVGELMRQATLRLAAGPAVLFLHKADRRLRRKITCGAWRPVPGRMRPRRFRSKAISKGWLICWGVIQPVEELFSKQPQLPPDTNRCVAAIAYLKSRAGRKSRRSLRGLLEDIGRFLGGE